MSYVEMLILYELWGVVGTGEGCMPISVTWSSNFGCRVFFVVQALIIGVLVALMEA